MDCGTQEVPGLAALAPETVKRLLEAGRLVHIPKGWTPIHDSVPSDKAYLILEGNMEVVTSDEVIARVGVGAFVGEMGLVDPRCDQPGSRPLPQPWRSPGPRRTSRSCGRSSPTSMTW